MNQSLLWSPALLAARLQTLPAVLDWIACGIGMDRKVPTTQEHKSPLSKSTFWQPLRRFAKGKSNRSGVFFTFCNKRDSVEDRRARFR